MTDVTVPEPEKRKAPITLLKERAEAAEARVRELEAGTGRVATTVSAVSPVPVDISVFYKDLLVALVTHDPGAMTHEVLPGKKKNAVLAYLAYVDLVERHDEFAAILAAENAQRDEKDRREQAEIAAERKKSEDRKRTNAERKGPVSVVKNVRTPEEAFLEDAKRQGALAGPMSPDQE